MCYMQLGRKSERAVHNRIDDHAADGEVVLHCGGEDVGGLDTLFGGEGILKVRVPEALGGRTIHEGVGVHGIADDNEAVEHPQAVSDDGQRHILHLGERVGIGAAVGFGHQHGVGVVVGALPVVVAGDGGAAQHLRVTRRPVDLREGGGHEGAGLIGGLDLHVLDEIVDLLHQLLIEDLDGGAVVALVVEPRGCLLAGQLARVGVVTQIVVNRRGDDEHIAHHAVVGGGAGATGAQDVGIGEVKAAIHQHGGQAHRGIDLAHAGDVKRHAILDVQLVVLEAADDVIFLTADDVVFIVVLSLARKIPGHVARFELGQDEHLDGDRLDRLGHYRQAEGEQHEHKGEHGKQLFHKCVLSCRHCEVKDEHSVFV